LPHPLFRAPPDLAVRGAVADVRADLIDFDVGQALGPTLEGPCDVLAAYPGKVAA
jgi:hypothetical protein